MIAALLAAGWFAASLVAAGVIGRGIRIARGPEPEPDFLADQPVEVLSPAEVQRRLALIVGGVR